MTLFLSIITKILVLLLISVIKSCGLDHVAVDPPIQIPIPNKQGRLLQQQTPHNIKIHGQFLLSNASSSLAALIQTVFNISSIYYSKIITTTTTQISDLPFEAISACNVTLQTVPTVYLQTGFDPKAIDLVVFVQLLPNNIGNYVALATACVSVRRPIYGYMNINPPQFEFTTISNFQSSLQIIIHQIAHVLGFGRVYFNNFYVSPTSVDVLPLTSVLRNISGRTYVISSNVLKFVQKYFNCKDNTTGGLLQNQGTASTALNHWERDVYYNQLMTSSALQIGMRLSALSLSLLKDTNYYSNVDISLSETIYWGHQSGCLFARSQIKPPPYYCYPGTSPRVACDFYSDSISFCSADYDIYAQGSAFYVPYSNGICNNVSIQIGNQSSNFFNIKQTSSSKCFYVRQVIEGGDSLEASSCYQTECMSNGSIRITVDKQFDNCIFPGQTLTFGNFSIFCPTNFLIFCSSKTCKNSCNNKGFCIKGFCVCVPPFRGNLCQIQCEKYKNNITQICVDKCSQNQYIYPPNICVNSCPNNYISNFERQCQYCDQRCQKSIVKL